MNKVVNELLDINFDDKFNNDYTDKIISLYQNAMKAMFSVDKNLINEAVNNIDSILHSVNIIKSSDIDIIINSLPDIKKALILDATAIFEGDPASQSVSEVIHLYPGFKAISCYRIAHILYGLKYIDLARILTEYAHSLTGIDINAGAKIGKSFFIDHGTGIVIGETSIIGDNCKIYQGVTLGALSLKDGRNLVGSKRHPTLKDNVVIYSGASIFGGNTIIGSGSIIGSNVEIKESIPDNTVVKSTYCKSI